MIDKIIFSADLDSARGLAEDGKAFVKVDNTSIGFDLDGKLRSLGSTSIVPSVNNGHAIASILVNSVPTSIQETVSSLVSSTPTCSFTYTNEAGAAVTIDGNLFLSKLAGNSLIVGTDGGIYFTSNVTFTDDQILSGDSTGTVSITLTPTTSGENTNYLVKADTKLAPATPSGKSNLIKNSATTGAGVYVDPIDIITALGLKLVLNKTSPAIELQDADNTVISSLAVGKVTNLSGTISRGWLDLT